MAQLDQEWINSVTSFQRYWKVHRQLLIPCNCRPFIDDTAIKELKDRYDYAEYALGIPQFAPKYAQIFRQFMHNCWTAGIRISGLTSTIGMLENTIVGFLCDED